ncbi:MAG: hemerythrin domain-containing protein [Hyphomicrobiales bacterium]|nr:hemerythrin domain-containing protein [Hyphomicrobiales bacterium]MCP5374391.1 hemerythrin domain-containing protein [Hyphomicrobiales bacterium]
MSTIAWTDALNIGVGFMDLEHQSAVDCINTMAKATGEELREAMDIFYDHCVEHFAHEEDMMRNSQFFAFEVHRKEHRRVLDELDDVRARLADGQEAELREYFSSILPNWFVRHRNSMDLAAATFARQMGYTG